MGRSCFSMVLLLSFFLVLLFSTGFGRKMVQSPGHDQASEVNESKSREMMELDYINAGPNTNNNGFVAPCSPPPSPPPPPPPPPKR